MGNSLVDIKQTMTFQRGTNLYNHLIIVVLIYARSSGGMPISRQLCFLFFLGIDGSLTMILSRYQRHFSICSMWLHLFRQRRLSWEYPLLSPGSRDCAHRFRTPRLQSSSHTHTHQITSHRLGRAQSLCRGARGREDAALRP